MRRRYWSAVAALGIVAVGCGGSDDDSEIGGAGGTGDIVLDPNYAAVNPSSFEGSLGEGTFGDGSCAAHVYEAEVIPADLYLMFDSSGSMDTAAAGERRIDAVRDALAQFLGDPGSGGLGVGLGVFGHLPLGFTSCDPGDYREPVAAFGVLPSYFDTLEAALDILRPVGETPTAAAIRGACDYVQDWKRGNPSHYTAVVLVTDGIPEATVTPGCDPTLTDAASAASECVDLGISVYVVGVGDELTGLNQIARAGGTKQAHLVESDDVAGELLEALNGIRGGAPLQCEFRIPDAGSGQTLDLERVNVRYVDPDHREYDVFFTGDRSHCDADTGGWYYDDSLAPTRLVLCPTTCDQITEEVHGTLGVAYGCATLRELK